MENTIIRNIRKHYLFDFFKCLFFSILITPSALTPLLILMADSSSVEDSYIFFTIIITLIFALLAIFFLYNTFKNFYYFIYPSKSDVYKEYPNLNEILTEINTSIEHEDQQIIISKRYMISKKDYRILILLNEILAFYIYAHKTNFVVDEYDIVAIDKYGIAHYFKYEPGQKEIMNNTLFFLQHKCPNAKFGCSDETLKYISDNKISKKINKIDGVKL